MVESVEADMEAQTPCFNLIDEPWIPVRWLDGRHSELGIREALLQADQIAEIEDASPLVVAALHRFLLAVLYRALEGPTDGQQAKQWFKQGWPEGRVEAYLEKWRDRFWLFDQHYPFGQIPGYAPKKWHAWTVLAAEHNANNAKVLIDHVDVSNPGAIPLKKATRWLLALQAFALGGGNSDFVYTKSAPSPNAVMAIPIGSSLFSTLMFSLVPQNRMITEGDCALWEREPETVEGLGTGPQRICNGFADLFLWRTRAIRFEQPTNGESAISRVGLASGVGFSPSNLDDPMLGYRISKDGGKFPVQFSERSFWRDFQSMLPDANGLAPRTVENAIALGRADPARFPRAILVTGFANKPGQAKIEFWRMEHFALPHTEGDIRRIRTAVEALLEVAEHSGKVLNSACEVFARFLLTRGNRKLKQADITAFVGQMPVTDNYWASLEARFHQILGEYTDERDPDDIRLSWLRYVRSAMSSAWRAYASGVAAGDAWAIRALVHAEAPILRHLTHLNDEISKLDPLKEPA
jgi:CRISPR system Cascade subunit CasA